MENFQKFLLTWHAQHGRHDLPWRQTTEPYKILVSELMLQQTQVERVIAKYQAFIQAFPQIEQLAAAPLSQVLILWQGLGYNRRARFLHQTAQAVTEKLGGHFPQSEEELLQLPGVGHYTARAILAFAYDKPVDLVETNVRAVFLYHFFPEQDKVPDAELLPLVHEAQQGVSARQFYAALMDYGSYLKRVLPNPSRRSKHHTTQSKFLGSLRQTRGALIRALTAHHPEKEKIVYESCETELEQFQTAVEQLIAEGLVVRQGSELDFPEK